jgi:hypothetical protein
MRNHVEDFNPCKANADILSSYLETNELDWTVDNLEVAFVASESQLAPKQKPAVREIEPTVVDNTPAPVATVAPAPAVAAVPTEQVHEPAAVPNTPAPARRLPNGGLEPGQFSGTKPSVKPAGLTKEDIKKWSGPEMRKRMRDPKQRAEIYRVLGQSA